MERNPPEDAPTVHCGAGKRDLVIAGRGNSPCRLRVKTGKAQCEHMFSALPPKADIEHQTSDVRKVPFPDSCSAAIP